MMDDTNLTSVADIVAILRRQMRLIGLAIALVLGLAAVFLFSATPLYTAQTLILVQPNQKNLLDPAQQSVTSGQAENAFVESQVEILRADHVALMAVQSGNIVADPEFGPGLSLRQRIAQAVGLHSGQTPTGAALLSETMMRFKSAINVRRRGLTYLIAVSFTSQSPDRAAELANLVAQTYISAQLDAKVAATLAARDVLDAQLDQAQERLTQFDRAMADYIDAHVDRFAQQTGDPTIARLRHLLASRRAQQSALQEQYGAMSRALENQDWAGLAQGLQDDALRALQQQRQDLAHRLTQSTQEGAVDLRAQIDLLDRQLAIDAQAVLQGVKGQLTTARQQSDAAQDNLRLALLDTNLPDQALADLYTMQQNAAIAQSQYDNLLLRLRDLEVQASVQLADSRIVSPALPPRQKSFPNAKLVLALAAVVGAMIGAGIALLNEFYIGGVHSAKQLSNLLRLKAVESVPRLPRSAEFLSPADGVVDQPMSIYAEALRRIKAAIERRLDKGARGSVIAVTSSVAAEGKSVMSLSLARSFAVAGKNVLLIDADLRKPTQYRLLGIAPKSGLLEYLTSTSETASEDFYELDPKTSLGVLLGHKPSGVPTDQPLQSDAFASLLDAARDSFDVIIVDTPPVLPLVDTRYVLPLADCVVMVVRAGGTGQSEIRTCHEQIAEAADPATPVIAVLNCVDEAGVKRYGGAYFSDG